MSHSGVHAHPGHSWPGIHAIPIPTPFLVGDINAYLIKDDPLTLVDTGPNLATSLAVLEAGLAEVGVRIEELERIVLTHQHSDHIGLLSVLAERSGAEVACWAPLAPWLSSYGESAALDDEYARLLLARHGVPEELNAALAVSAYLSRAFGSGAAVSRPLEAGASVEFASRSFEVLHRPGHSPSDIVLWDAAAGVLIGGDHLMSAVASNAILTRPLGATLLGLGRSASQTQQRSGGVQPGGGVQPSGGVQPGGGVQPDGVDAPRPRPLIDYRASLRESAGLPDGLVILPGHGPAVCAHRELITERLRIHERRARKLLRTLTAAGTPMTAYALAAAMWGRVAFTQGPLMVSEVLGLLDLLHAEQQITEHDDGAVVRFSAARQP